MHYRWSKEYVKSESNLVLSRYEPHSFWAVLGSALKKFWAPTEIELITEAVPLREKILQNTHPTGLIHYIISNSTNNIYHPFTFNNQDANLKGATSNCGPNREWCSTVILHRVPRVEADSVRSVCGPYRIPNTFTVPKIW